MSARSSAAESLTSYDLFVLALSLLAVGNIGLLFVFRQPAIVYIIQVMDLVVSGFFLADFIRRLVIAKHKWHYFVRDYGWADLLSSVPLPEFNILRLFRLFRAWSIVRRTGLRSLGRILLRAKATSSLLSVIFLAILLLEFASIAIFNTEAHNPHATITSAEDALWWVYITITTIGYGDTYPVTQNGRIVGIIVALVGVSIFGIITGYWANKFLPSSRKQTHELEHLRKEVAEIKALIQSQK